MFICLFRKFQIIGLNSFLCSSHRGFLKGPSKQGSSKRIKHESRYWENQLKQTIWVGYFCRRDVISAVQREQKMKPCILFPLKRKYNSVLLSTLQRTYSLGFASHFCCKNLKRWTDHNMSVFCLCLWIEYILINSKSKLKICVSYIYLDFLYTVIRLPHFLHSEFQEV